MADLKKILILVASVRQGRKSDRVALFFKGILSAQNNADVELVDLNEYQFPIFNERLKFMKQPDAAIVEFAGKIKNADGVLIVTPEYNGGYPASLKNVIDLLYDEWKRKPIAITTVSSGPFAGSQVITSLLFTLWKIGAWVVPAMFPVAKVEESFDENGKPADVQAAERRAETFIKEFFLVITAHQSVR